MDKKAFLYALVLPNGKRYIGMSVRPERRLAEHICSAQRGSENPIHRALRAHNFVVRQEVWCAGTEQYIRDLEIKAIRLLGTRHPARGYNVTHGGELSPMRCASVRAKVSAAKLGHIVTSETRLKISNTKCGQRLSAEHKKKIGAGNKGKHVGATRSPATRLKMSLAAQARPKPSPESIAKTAAFNRGKPRSLETRTKIQQARLRFYEQRRRNGTP